LSDANKALALCQKYIDDVENKDLSGVEETLAGDARQIFRHTKQVTQPGMFDHVSSGILEGAVVAVLKDRPEVLAYTKGLMANFHKIKWTDTKWKLSRNGEEVYFFGRGDMITEKSRRPYHNTYITRFDFYENRITEINEIGDAMLYIGLGIAPNAAQLRAFGRALLRPIGIGMR